MIISYLFIVITYRRMVTSFVSICLRRFGFSFFKLKWKTKIEFKIRIQSPVILKIENHFVFCLNFSIETKIRSSHPEVFLVKGVLKICSKFTGEHLLRTPLNGCFWKIKTSFLVSNFSLPNKTKWHFRYKDSVSFVLVFKKKKSTPRLRIFL